MMKKILIASFICVLCCGAARAQKTPPTAEEIINATVAKAKKEHKKALVLFHASWCEWCKKMDASINAPACKKYFKKNFVIGVIDVFETGSKAALDNAGGDLMYEAYGGDNGLPFWLIFDGDGNLLADANISANGNVGCPSEEADVNAFVNLLKKYTPMTDAEAKAVHDRFVKNKVN